MIRHRDKTGEIVESTLKQDKRTGLHYRLDTSDKNMIRDSFKNYELLNVTSEDTVLDLGANIGAFMIYALQRGAAVYAVEAERMNYEMMEYNLYNCWGGFDSKIRMLQAAVVPSDYEGDTVTFTMNKSKSSACSGRIKRGNTSWIETEVDAIRFDKLIEIYQPNVLKMDIETGEYGIIDRPMPECIRRMGIELHGTNKLDYARMMATIEFLEKDWSAQPGGQR